MSLRRQRGFTLMEVMVSSSATAIVIAAATAFLLKFLGWYDELSARIAINRHARETYEVLSLGALSSSSGNDGTKNLYGLRVKRNGIFEQLLRQFLEFGPNFFNRRLDTPPRKVLRRVLLPSTRELIDNAVFEFRLFRCERIAQYRLIFLYDRLEP